MITSRTCLLVNLMTGILGILELQLSVCLLIRQEFHLINPGRVRDIGSLW